MVQSSEKPLNWKPAPGVGYTVERRPDGGMHYTFTDASADTLEHWREFAMEHLLDSDRLTRNLYDLRQLEEVGLEAIQYGLEVGSDPAARNIRLAVVVANENVRRAMEELAALNPPGGVDMQIFTDMDEAEEWLERPLTLLT